MKNIFYTFFILILSTSQIFAQDQFQKGFDMLEKGEFKDAAVFFKNYLDNVEPNNKTALICYGRGIGLSGNVNEAKNVFHTLLLMYPGDYEVSLNLAEALMWEKSYKQAKIKYIELLKVDSTNFVANLGYANALSNLKQYKEAYAQINKAVDIDPNNPNAKISKKYILLGYAYELQKVQEYKQAKSYLQQILKVDPKDTDANFLLAQIYTQEEEYDKAIEINQRLLGKLENHNRAYLNLSYIYHLKGDDKNALKYANYAVNDSKMGTDEYLNAKLGEASVWAWEGNFKYAFEILKDLEVDYPKNAKLLTKKASILTWNKSYKESIMYFNQALALDPNSFDANLGIADAYLAQEDYNKSMEAVNKTLKYYPNQVDAENFKSKIVNKQLPEVNFKTFHSSDKGGNTSNNILGDINFDIAKKIRLKFAYSQRNAKNSIENVQAGTKTLTIGLRNRITPFWVMKIEGSYLQSLKDNFLFYFSNKFNLSPNQELELVYNKGFQDFTASLIENNFTFDNYSATYNLNTSFKVGLYSQFHYTNTSDNNTRQLAFVSLYYQALKKPIVKFGLNYNWMTFKYQRSNLYFSPSKFNSLEFFALGENLDLPKQKYLYHASGAIGTQKIEQEKSQNAYRFRFEAGYLFKERFRLLGYYLNSNSATSTVAGYSYQEFGLNLRYSFIKD